MRPHKLILAAAFALVASAAHAFPVTIQHAFGETVVPSEPLRIVAWDWGSDDALIALGVAPVGMPFFSYGGDADGYHPWARARLEEMGATMPTIIPVGEGVPAESIAALDPDLIIAAYSGIDDEEYRRLSQIAPVVAYPGDPWSTTWQDVVRIVGKAIGKDAEAEALVAETEAFITSTVAAYPEIGRSTFAVVTSRDGNVIVYTPVDARLKFLVDAGMTLDPSILEMTDEGAYSVVLSQEEIGRIGSDIFITWFESKEDTESFLARPLIARAPQVQAGAVASLNDPFEISPISPPTPLSLRWGLPLYVERIAAATRAAGL